MARAGNNHKGGRPKGKILDKTKMIRASMEQYRARAAGIAQTLLSTQAIEAIGAHTILRREFHGKDIKWVVVRDADEIERVFNELGGIDSKGMVDDTYYIITQDKPNHKAAVSILDRTWGKPKEEVAITGAEGGALLINLAK